MPHKIAGLYFENTDFGINVDMVNQIERYGGNYSDNSGITIDKKDNIMSVHMDFKQDTLIASKEFVKNNLQEIIEWAFSK